MIRRISFATTLAALAFATPAIARVPLTQERADRAALRDINEEVARWQDQYDPSLPDGVQTVTTEDDQEWTFLNATVKRFDLDPCDFTGRYNAECAATLWMSDGSGCDENVLVSTTRRGRIITGVEATCDALDGDGGE